MHNLLGNGFPEYVTVINEMVELSSNDTSQIWKSNVYKCSYKVQLIQLWVKVVHIQETWHLDCKTKWVEIFERKHCGTLLKPNYQHKCLQKDHFLFIYLHFAMTSGAKDIVQNKFKYGARKCNNKVVINEEHIFEWNI